MTAAIERQTIRNLQPFESTVRQCRQERCQLNLVERIEGAGGEDPLMSPVQANVLHGMRRALAIALAVGENFAEASGLADLKRDTLAGALGVDKKTAFSELLAAEALAVSMTASEPRKARSHCAAKPQ